MRVAALKVSQTGTRDLYIFGLEGKQVERIAGISRISKGPGFDIIGYQRTEAQKHIVGITRYIDSLNPMIPNSIVVAFNDSVTFENCSLDNQDDGAIFGYLNIPEANNGDALPGWIVDGQQRVAACREAQRMDFKLIVSSFITNSADDQREQFVLVNSAKPLPKSLIYELVPSTTGLLPEKLVRKKLAISVMQRLNFDPKSSLHERIKTITNPNGLLTDNSIIRLLENSLSDGYLYKYRNPITGEGNIDTMTSIVSTYFDAVKEVFKEDWDLPASKTRLNHGAGLAALGYLMDEIALAKNDSTSTYPFKNALMKIKPNCAWSSGYWKSIDGNKINWNDLQNTAQDIKLLSEILTKIYRDE